MTDYYRTDTLYIVFCVPQLCDVDVSLLVAPDAAALIDLQTYQREMHGDPAEDS